MKAYIVTYSWPLRYRGTYLTTAADSLEAGEKIKNYLREKYGYAGDEVSSVHEIYDNGIQVVA